MFYILIHLDCTYEESLAGRSVRCLHRSPADVKSFFHVYKIADLVNFKENVCWKCLGIRYFKDSKCLCMFFSDSCVLYISFWFIAQALSTNVTLTLTLHQCWQEETDIPTFFFVLLKIECINCYTRYYEHSLDNQADRRNIDGGCPHWGLHVVSWLPGQKHFQASHSSVVDCDIMVNFKYMKTTWHLHALYTIQTTV